VAGSTLPILTIAAALVLIWYVAAIFLNAPVLRDSYERAWRAGVTTQQLVADAWAMERPILPAPHQVAFELNKTVFQIDP
ncbi:hypothetical protein ACE4Z5_28190, partial [Salmonella enterica]